MTPDVLRAGGHPDVTPRPPALCLFYDDLADPREPTPVFGQYPAALIPKLLPWLACKRHEILHLCSGALPPGEGIRVDMRADAAPDVVADARDLPRDRFPDGSAAAVMLDPPYTPEYAERLYGVTDYPLPAHLLREAVRVVRPGGMIAFVHYLVPMPPPGRDLRKGLGSVDGVRLPDAGRHPLPEGARGSLRTVRHRGGQHG
jgi:SAM-dependent methyltransferase